MPDPTPNRPLWQVMYESDVTVTQETGPIISRRMFAAELRAIAEWVRQRHPLTPDSPTYLGASLVVAELQAEADRAEAP